MLQTESSAGVIAFEFSSCLLMGCKSSIAGQWIFKIWVFLPRVSNNNMTTILIPCRGIPFPSSFFILKYIPYGKIMKKGLRENMVLIHFISKGAECYSKE